MTGSPGTVACVRGMGRRRGLPILTGELRASGRSPTDVPVTAVVRDLFGGHPPPFHITLEAARDSFGHELRERCFIIKTADGHAAPGFARRDHGYSPRLTATYGPSQARAAGETSRRALQR